MQTRQRLEVSCGRRSALAELGMWDERDQATIDPSAPVGFGCRCGQCTDTQWDAQRLKFWLAARLLAFGATEAVVDRHIGSMSVDVFWRRDDQWYAIEVRDGPLTQELASEHTQRLRGLGCTGVLWLCTPGYWVAQLPALGIDDLSPQGCDYRVASGMLTVGADGLAARDPRSWELRDFLRGWVAGEVAWGYRDELTKGWATVTDWEQHTQTQAMVIARQHQELVNQRTTLALSRKAMRDRTKQLMRATHRLERAGHNAERQADDLADLTRQLDDRRRDYAALRTTVWRLHKTINHWQLITCFVMLLLATFLTAVLVLR